MGAKKAAKKAAGGAGPETPAAPAPVAAPAVTGQATEHEAAKKSPVVADLSFAVNIVKLNRAKAYVQKMAPNAKGEEFAALVKERYLELKGLLIGDKPVVGKKRGKMTGIVVNAADNDEA